MTCAMLLVWMAATAATICYASPQPHSKECPEFCSPQYDPVCGTDHNTYSNICELQKAACDSTLSLKYTGKCQRSRRETKPGECPKVCTKEHNPVCGSDGETYSNKCELQQASCLDSSITVKHCGECGAMCPETCSAEYDPVCGTDGHTYSNLCNLEKAKCNCEKVSLQYPGICKGQECEAVCAPIQNPVCGTDGKTYSNIGCLAVASCKNPSIKFAQSGHCHGDEKLDVR